ncbi:MAG: hypothetical protein JWL96_1986 [Sphingomonas bacterium]|uniref:COG3904 family protein n=1 Tax=Sphingomonas bacterium TaxID=1895847 RepID=UPI00260465AF|nr:hypothetical protein [Sphingomonas bacterium]MDB5709916.1 hypothetical protein [Sphingomonas bacterium]
MIEGSPRWHAIRAGAALLLAFGLLVSGGAAPANASDRAMSFTLENETAATIAAHRQHDHGDRTVYASGPITAGATEALLALIRTSHLEHARIYFDSPGGEVAESMKLGEEIRSHHLNTAIGRPDDKPDEESEAICASACVFAYAGGENRFMAANSGRLGIHQFSSAKRKAAIAETQAISGLIVAYLSHMDVDPNAFALQAMVDPTSIMWLTPKQARALGFVNDGARPSTAEIKVVDMVPVLMLTQQRYDMEMSTAVICGTGGYRINTWLHADYTDATQMRGLTRAYFELDGQLALDRRGADSARYDRGGITVSRGMSDETLARLLAANAFALWVEDDRGQRWGSAMDLRDIHDKMAEYFTECSRIPRTVAAEPARPSARAPAPPAAPTRAAVATRPAAPIRRVTAGTHVVPASAPGHADLVITGRVISPGNRQLVFVDLATTVRKGHLATATGYVAMFQSNVWDFFEDSYTYECDGPHYQAVGHAIDRSGRDLGAESTAWTTVPPDSAGQRMQRLVCGQTEVEDRQRIANTDPYEVLRGFVARVADLPDNYDGSKPRSGGKDVAE